MHAYRRNVYTQNLFEPIKINLKVNNGYVYMEIQRGMHGIPQATILDNTQLKQKMSQ